MVPLVSLKVVPNFYEGHTYLWDVSTKFTEPFPWTFVIEQADVPYTSSEQIPGENQWTAISPQLVNTFAWVSDFKPVYTKNFSTCYRVSLTTGNNKKFYSEPHTVFSDIDRDSWMIIKEIQRKEVLHMRNMAGVPCKLYQVKQTGIKCTHCTSPDTGEILDASCPWCLGTGKIGGYHGPYPCWGKFDVFQRQRTYGESEIGTMTDVRLSYVRLIGNPYIFMKDILVDTSSDRRYRIYKVEPELEIRRIIVIQRLFIDELSPQDVAYRLGTNEPIGQEKC